MNPPIVVYTMDQYISLSSALAEGATSVQYGDKRIDYRSVDEMLRILAIMKRQLFPCSDNNNGVRFVSFSKGTTPRRRRYRF